MKQTTQSRPPIHPHFPYTTLFRSIEAPMQINQVASLNRAAADELILAYINRLSSSNLPAMGRGRAMLALSVLVRPQIEFWRSEEHTSALPSPCNLVCRPLLDKTET